MPARMREVGASRWCRHSEPIPALANAAYTVGSTQSGHSARSASRRRHLVHVQQPVGAAREARRRSVATGSNDPGARNGVPVLDIADTVNRTAWLPAGRLPMNCEKKRSAPWTFRSPPATTAR